MHFNQVTLILIAATGALATPLGQDLEARNPESTLLSSESVAEGESFEVWGRDLDARDSDLNLLSSENTADGGSFEAWGKREAKPLNARWTSCASGTITPKCDDENGGQNVLCVSLLNYLSAYGTTKPPSGSKQLCYAGSGGKCCTGWNVDVPNLTYSALVNNVQTMYQTCSGSSGNSAKMNGVKLINTCANQCLNNGHQCS
ncbi:putative WD-like domain-containing protein [Seiridium cardinale]|uniref:WD-like domain-containing protein n=1 Tax=Seiridium cardinale TaxID=138064 RepID=A0ABR2X799_9PEZI